MLMTECMHSYSTWELHGIDSELASTLVMLSVLSQCQGFQVGRSIDHWSLAKVILYMEGWIASEFTLAYYVYKVATKCPCSHTYQNLLSVLI